MGDKLMNDKSGYLYTVFDSILFGDPVDRETAHRAWEEVKTIGWDEWQKMLEEYAVWDEEAKDEED